MVRITAVFIAGILTCIGSPGMLGEFTAAILFFSFLFFYYLVRFSVQGDLLKIATGILGLSAVFVSGFLVVWQNEDSSNPDHLLQNREPALAFEVKIISPLEEKRKSWKRTGEVTAVLTGSGWKKAYGKVNLYWAKSEAVADLEYGDHLLVQGIPALIEGPRNPGEFDLMGFMQLRHIHHQYFIKQGTWVVVQKSNDKGFLYYAHYARHWSVTAIKKYIGSGREQAIVSALVLGVTDGLDNELRSAYAASGAMHVLAVSGLHVAVIYGLLIYLLRPLEKVKGGRLIGALISLVLLWAYAFITGLSPSVLRAVAMFSFVVLARPMKRNTNIYNTLAASAFFLLLYDPYLIMSVGFQLSYLAVLGIVYLQRPLFNLWMPQSAFMSWAWQITCVSVAAQVGTVALTLFYFHQFPVYSLLANLFIIPGSTVVLLGGMALLMVSPLGAVAQLLGYLLEYFVWLYNEGVLLVERLPFSLISEIYLSPLQCFLLFGMIVCILALARLRRFSFVVLMISCAMMFSIAGWQHLFEEVDRQALTIYSVPHHRTMGWVMTGHALFTTDSALRSDREKMGYHIEPGRIAKGVRQVSGIPAGIRRVVGGMELYRRNGKTFLAVIVPEFELPVVLHADYLIISNNSVKSLQTFAKHVKFDHIILDSSNSSMYGGRLETQAKEMGVSCFNVTRQGAFILNL